MRLKNLISIALLGLLVVSGTTWAGKDKGSEESESTELVILDTAVPQVDAFYDKVEGMIAQLQSARADVDSANVALCEALGLATGTPVADALADLQSKAEGKIQLVLEGTRPTLQATEAVPENVQAGIDAVNAMAGKLASAVQTLQQVSSDVKPMIGEAADMPKAIAESSLGLKEKAAATKAATSNLKATKQIPVQADALAQSCNDTLELIKSTFGG